MIEKWEELKEFIDSEISFHEEYVTPLWFSMLCHRLGKRTPQELVVRELNTIKQEIEMLEGHIK